MGDVAEPLPPYLDNVAALLLVLIRDCKINKPMLIKVGVPAIVRTLQRHSNRSLSPTTVQALSGVLTLLAMSKTMLDIVLQTGGLPLIVELLRYEAPDSSAANAPDTIVRQSWTVDTPCLRHDRAFRWAGTCVTQASRMARGEAEGFGAGRGRERARGCVCAHQLPMRPQQQGACPNRADGQRCVRAR